MTTPTFTDLSLHIQILAETPDLVAVNKPSGFHSAPLRENEPNTVLGAVGSLYPECLAPMGRKPIEGGLLHRLDQGTSGVLVFARNSSAYEKLRLAWEKRIVHKDYLAWVEGKLLGNHFVELALGHSPKNKKKMIVIPASRIAKSKHWRAISHIQSLAAFSAHSLVQIRIYTGVTHQIRATLAAFGHPVLKDPVYRKPQKSLQWKEHAPAKDSRPLPTPDSFKIKNRSISPCSDLLPENGFFLHAYRLDLGKYTPHPLIAPPPSWFSLSN